MKAKACTRLPLSPPPPLPSPVLYSHRTGGGSLGREGSQNNISIACFVTVQVKEEIYSVFLWKAFQYLYIATCAMVDEIRYETLLYKLWKRLFRVPVESISVHVHCILYHG